MTCYTHSYSSLGLLINKLVASAVTNNPLGFYSPMNMSRAVKIKWKMLHYTEERGIYWILCDFFLVIDHVIGFFLCFLTRNFHVINKILLCKMVLNKLKLVLLRKILMEGAYSWWFWIIYSCDIQIYIIISTLIVTRLYFFVQRSLWITLIFIIII